MPNMPSIPTSIVIHIGAPTDNGMNVTERFSEYIKNVASSEIYPTWPENALRANILAQISVALNRVYTRYYRNRGFDFDITSSPAYDQTYIYQRDIFSNISVIVDEIFDSYIRRIGTVEPLFAQFCDGIEVSCNGLSQWGSVELANDGLDYEDILRRYYGDDIEIVRNVPIQSVTVEAPTLPLSEGDSGRYVELVQIRLNRISANFPGIPKINPVDGFFDRSTTDAVMKFQEIFALDQDGIVGRATWNSITHIYNSVKRLYHVSSEGLSISELETTYTDVLRIGMTSAGVLTLQYYLSYIALFIPSVQSPAVDGTFGNGTMNAVRSYQSTYGIEESGEVDELTWNSIENTYYGILQTIPYEYEDGLILPYPGRVLRLGIEGDDVRALQEYLNFIADYYPSIPKVNVDGTFGTETARAVRAFNEEFGLPGNPERVTALVWNAIINVYDDLYTGSFVRDEQFPGFGG